MIERVPVRTSPKLFDLAVSKVQAVLANITWLDHVFGICEKLTDVKDGKKFHSANAYIGKGQYEQIMPCDTLGNFAFFILRDPQALSTNGNNTISSPVSLILWYDMRKVSLPTDERNREQIKGQIMGVLNRLHIANLEITRIYEKPDNVFGDFSYDQTDNRFLMHPFAGLRIDGYMTVRADCFTFPNEGVGNGSFSDESFDTSSDI